MLKHYINYEEHLRVMERFGQRFQVVCRSKLFIGLGDISGPGSMAWDSVWRLRAIIVLFYLVDPNDGEADRPGVV